MLLEMQVAEPIVKGIAITMDHDVAGPRADNLPMHVDRLHHAIDKP